MRPRIRRALVAFLMGEFAYDDAMHALTLVHAEATLKEMLRG